MSDIYSIMKAIGAKLKAERVAQEMKQTDLASLLGKSRQHVSSIEKGANFGIEELIKILMILDRSDLINPLIEKTPISPIALAKLESKTRKRAGR